LSSMLLASMVTMEVCCLIMMSRVWLVTARMMPQTLTIDTITRKMLKLRAILRRIPKRENMGRRSLL